MQKDILKVIVKDGHEQEFEKYCNDNSIFCRAYPLEILKTRYRVECKPEQLKGAVKFIKNIKDMPTLKAD